MSHDPIFDDYVRKLAALKLWYVRWLMDNEGMGFDDAARKRVNLFRMTRFAGSAAQDVPEDQEGWRCVLHRLERMCERHSGDPDTSAFEAEGVELLWPHMQPVIAWELEAFDEFGRRAIGCFQYEFAKYYGDPEAEDHLTLHVRNTYRPDSMFRHLPQVAGSLLEIAERAGRERPEVTWVQCGSWLNSLPPFAGLFPQSWVALAQPGRPGNHMGWWGQFQDRRGGFHERNAGLFRATGRFPYQHMLCHCPIGELSEHLRSLPRE